LKKTLRFWATLLLVGALTAGAVAAVSIVRSRKMHGTVYLDYGESGVSFITNTNEMMYKRCYLTVVNEMDSKAYVRISATAGLLDRHTIFAQKELTGYGQDLCTDIFPVEPGENKLIVYFGAPYGKPDATASGRLPWNIRITPIPEDDPGITAVAEEQHFGAQMLIGAEEVEEGRLFAEYDFDRDGTTERLEIYRENDAEWEAKGGHAPLQVRLYDDGELSGKVEVYAWLEHLQDVLLYDFHFEDGSLEVILRFGRDLGTGQQGPEEMTCLLRVVGDQLYVDTGRVFARSNSNVTPEDIQFGKLYSISGNRVTLSDNMDGTGEPVRIDLAESLDTEP